MLLERYYDPDQEQIWLQWRPGSLPDRCGRQRESQPIPTVRAAYVPIDAPRLSTRVVANVRWSASDSSWSCFRPGGKERFDEED